MEKTVHINGGAHPIPQDLKGERFVLAMKSGAKTALRDMTDLELSLAHQQFEQTVTDLRTQKARLEQQYDTILAMAAAIAFERERREKQR